MTRSNSVKCPTCKREATITDDRKVSMHLRKQGKPAAGACPSSLLSVSFVTNGRVQ